VSLTGCLFICNLQRCTKFGAAKSLASACTYRCTSRLHRRSFRLCHVVDAHTILVSSLAGSPCTSPVPCHRQQYPCSLKAVWTQIRMTSAQFGSLLGEHSPPPPHTHTCCLAFWHAPRVHACTSHDTLVTCSCAFYDVYARCTHVMCWNEYPAGTASREVRTTATCRVHVR
jgi:hypothetical protein